MNDKIILSLKPFTGRTCSRRHRQGLDLEKSVETLEKFIEMNNRARIHK